MPKSDQLLDSIRDSPLSHAPSLAEVALMIGTGTVTRTVTSLTCGRHRQKEHGGEGENDEAVMLV